MVAERFKKKKKKSQRRMTPAMKQQTVAQNHKDRSRGKQPDRQREMSHQQRRLQKKKSVWPPLPRQSAPGYYSNECNRKTDVIYLSHYSMYRTKRAGIYRQRGMRRGMME